MRPTPHTLLWLPVILWVLTSCSHTPRMVGGTESDYLLELRAEYLKSNPEGEFNDNITSGEVVKGMDILAVLAAWGHPDRRKKENALTERWIYRDLDEQTKDWLEYTLTFRRSVLTEWDLMRHFAAGGNVDVPDRRGATTLSRGDYAGMTVRDAPKK